VGAAAALVREAARDPAGRRVLEQEARNYVQRLARPLSAKPRVSAILREVAAP